MNCHKSLFIIVLSFFFHHYIFAQDAGLMVAADIPYRAKMDEYADCRLDVSYYGEGKDLPVIVWFHGGGLTSGHREIPVALQGKGCIVVGVGYRLCPKVRVSDCIDDAAAAIAWVFKHVEKYGGSKRKIYVAGHSAGGYLVMMASLDKHYLAKYGIDADSIKAVVPYSGQVISHFQYRNENGSSNPLEKPIIDEFAPIYHVRGDSPPMLLILGDREMELYGRYEENAYFARMMKLNGHQDVILYEEDGFSHGDMVIPGHAVFLKYLKEREKCNNHIN